MIRFEKNRGGSAAYIAGMKRALELEGDYVWLLDDDAKPNDRTLPELVAAMDSLLAKNVKVASVGSAVIAEGEMIECGCRFSKLLGHSTPCRSIGLNEVDYSAACSLLVNKAAVRECGFWEDVFIHFDDIEWGLRVKDAGWHNFATSASKVEHPRFLPDKAGDWIAYYDARNQFWLGAKYGMAPLVAAYLKNSVKNIIDLLRRKHIARIRYRRLAWRDYLDGVGRMRDEL